MPSNTLHSLSQITVKSLLQAHALRRPFPSLDAKNSNFSSKFPQKWSHLLEAWFFCKFAWDIEIKMKIEKKQKKTVLHYAETSQIYISREFLVVCLQWIVPPNMVHCLRPYFHFVRKYQPSLASCEPRIVLCPGQCIFKVLSIPCSEITVYRVNTLLPTDFATLASRDSNPYW